MKYIFRSRIGVDLGLEALDFRVLVLQLRPQLIGCHLLRLHDLHQVDVLLHEHLALDDDVRVAASHIVTQNQGKGKNGYGTYRFCLVSSVLCNTPLLRC